MALAATVLLPAAACEVSVLALLVAAEESAALGSLLGADEEFEGAFDEPPMLKTFVEPADSTFAPPSPPIDKVLATAGFGSAAEPLADG